MIALARILAAVVLVGLMFAVGMDISSPGRSGADEHTTTTTTAAPATTTTAAPATTTTARATTTTAAPATTTTAARATTTTAARATTTTAARATTTTARSTNPTAPATATTAPGNAPPGGAGPAGAGPTRAVTEPGTQTPTQVRGTTVERARSRIVREPAPNRPTTDEFRRARRLAPPPEPQGDVGPQQNLGRLFEPERVRPAAAGTPERGGLATKPLATGGLVLGAVAGLLLGLADRAAGLSARSR